MEQSPTLWQNKQISNFPKLTKNIETDVCIIGAGITGLSCAYNLSCQGHQVVVIDDGSIGDGETSRTTAHITAVLDDRYLRLEKIFGQGFSMLAADSHTQAIDFIENTVRKENISCAFERVNAYLFNPAEQTVVDLNEELQAARRAGLIIEKIERAPLPFDTGPCLKFPNQAQFRPLEYLKGLCESIVRNSGEIFSETHASQIQEANPCLTTTDTGFKIKSKIIIVATNSPINSRFFPHLKQASYRSYVIAGRIPKNQIELGLYYDTLDPYHYVRLDRGQDFDTLIVGGEDHRVGEEKHPELLYKILEAWTRERFPMLKSLTYCWSGQIIEPVDHLAFIGKTGESSALYIATGDSGNGITHGTIAGILLTDLIEGKTNPWQDLYNPHRKTLQAFGEFCEENGNSVWQYRDWFKPADAENEKALKPGCGAIFREGMKKMAVYKDGSGKIHRLSAVCPHLGGLVRWNSAEKTWDCACHGSRFTATGKAINAPTNDSLTQYE